MRASDVGVVVGALTLAGLTVGLAIAVAVAAAPHPTHRIDCDSGWTTGDVYAASVYLGVVRYRRTRAKNVITYYRIDKGDICYEPEKAN